MVGKKKIRWIELIVGLHPEDWYVTVCRDGGDMRHYHVSWILASMLSQLVRKMVLKQLVTVVPTAVGWIAYPKHSLN